MINHVFEVTKPYQAFLWHSDTNITERLVCSEKGFMRLESCSYNFIKAPIYNVIYEILAAP